MEALYDRMASSIAQNPSATDRELASAILQCVTCSLRVLTIAELSQALGEDTSEVMDLQRSVVDLCGGFVVIDNGGNVAMIHQTAREYLLGGNERPFHVDRNAAHNRMFSSCMRCLMAIGLRAKVNRNEKPELLDYAAGLWSSHLAPTPLDSEQTLEGLKKFLTGHWILTWIHVLAASKQLRVLIQASKHLSRYSAKRQEHYATQIETGQNMVEHELLDSWAVDFVKIVGKFGTNLRRNPESIYKLIPPFCPQNSSIYQLFGKSEAKSLMVSGLLTENWDDSLARISLGFGNYSSSISAAGSQIAILASSGSVFIYDSSIYEEAAASPIKHGERVYRFELNSTATLLATYGYRTTKIWEISTGKCKLSVANLASRPRPLAMLFVNNSRTLLVGADDRRIRSIDLTQESPTWETVAELEEPELEGHFLNSSSYMALNNDGSLIAVAYRGHPLSAWETDGPVHIGHCWRAREAVARGEVIEAVWHPHSPEILGLYIEGTVFKWRPYAGEPDEIATGASRLAISRDGNLFATGDVHGTVKVYTTSGFGLLYQLSSQDTVLGLAFSPDLRRFYDIRGYYANAWEPNALMRFADQSKDIESGSETESLARSSTASMSSSQRIDSITVLASSPTGRLYCCGTERGTVRLYGTQRGKLADLHVSKSFLSVEQMSWSSDGRYVAFSDSSKKVFIVSISLGPRSTDLPVVETVAEIPMKNITKGPILQLLFQPDSSHLLVHTTSMIHAVSRSTSATQLLELKTAEFRWITHPRDPTLIIGFGIGVIRILDWHLAERQTFTFEYSADDNTRSNPKSSPVPDALDRVLVTHDKMHVLVQISLPSRGSQEKAFLYFATSSFPTSKTVTPDTNQESAPAVLVAAVILPRNQTSQIALALSFLSHDRLVFLSRAFSICSWPVSSSSGPPSSSLLGSRPNSIAPASSARHASYNDTSTVVAGNLTKELFSLPGDWISRDCLVLCSIWARERSLLCPRNGEVAVVKCAALV